MAGVQARSQLRSAHPLLLLMNKFISLALFLALLGAGWIGLNFLRAGFQKSSLEAAPGSTPAAPTAPVAQNQAVRDGKSSADRLVYFCATDSGYYHTSTHLERCKRTALSEEAAVNRGLKRCPTCFRR
jgi:hypothetical protein